MNKINVTVLAARLRLVLAHVVSAGNPADAPSRLRFQVKVKQHNLKEKGGRLAGAHPARNQ